ncbi:MAG: tetratricopeptide repeat protein [Deltaproteobacteria bacterium]|nr:tetratricopeptide repeat protein [Deltaproteobacteria bacterium]
MKLTFVIVTVVFLICKIGAAQESRIEAAQAAYAEGVALYEAGDFVEAANAFRRANTMKFNWKVLYNIGQCEAAAKRHGMALQAFEEYLTRSGDDISVERRDEVLTEVNRLRQMVGLLEIEGPSGGEVWVDNEQRGTLPMAGPVAISAGVNHEVKIILDEKELYLREIRMVGGQSKNIQVDRFEPTDAGADDTSSDEVDSAEDTAAPSPALNTDHDGASGLKVGGLVTASVGMALVIGGGVVGGLALSKANQLEKDYPDGVPTPKHSEYDSAYTMANVSNVLIGVGAATAVTGIILLIVNKRKNQTEQVTVAPAVGPHTGGISLKGSF